eukprot:scaffold405_cov179-Ochromonas_danica.AAC.2
MEFPWNSIANEKHADVSACNCHPSIGFAMKTWLSRFLLIFLFFLSLIITIHSRGNLSIHQKAHSTSSHPEVIPTVTGNQTNPEPLPQWELDVLYDLYNSTQGEYWIWTGVPWNFSESNPDPCSENWEGVTCIEVCSKSVNGSDSCGEHIEYIILSNNNMTGSLPSSLGQLEQLRYLEVTSNIDLIGSIPSTLSNLSYLSILVLNSNGLTGTIPNSLTYSKALTALDVSTNHLTGSLPENISQLTILKYLYIYSNHISGSIPADIGSLSELTYFYSYSNLITGSFPQSIQNCTSMNSLAMYDNLMTGNLPSSVSKLKDMTYFNVYANLITGSIPNDIGSASALYYLSFQTNLLSEALPSSMGQLSSLYFLNVFDNMLSGSIPSTLYELPSIEELALSSNALSGRLDSAIGQWTTLVYLDLSYNFFTGSLPMELAQLTILDFFSVSYNIISGTLPETLGNWKNIKELYMGVNWFEGTIPVSFGNMTSLNYLYLETTLITGGIPEQLGKLSELTVLSLNGNLLSGTIPDSLTNITSLIVLLIGYSYCHGSIPQDIGRLSNLQYFSIAYAAYSGNLPISFSSLSNLEVAALTNNFLSGSLSALSIPSSHLEYLNISSNLFTGDTSPLSSLENMAILDISFNGLTGPFRACENMSKLLWLFLRGNELSGSLSGVFTSVSTPSLYFLDLSSNRFSGPFPWSDLSQLTQLNTLAAVQNCFTGTLSSDICKASKLEVLALDGLSAAPSCRRATVTLSDGLSSSWASSYIMGKHAVHGSLPSCLFQELSVLATLHLSGNSLEGSIPELLDSSSLTDLSLSHNELTGTVPELIQSNAWINLDLSFNKLTGTLKSSSWSSSLRNGSIALEINRLSGKIPSSYYDMSDVDVLRGNIFSCGEAGESDEESLPPNDPYKSQYGCGSVTLNVSLLVWVSVVGGLLLLGVCVWVCLKRRRRSGQGDQEVSGRELEKEKEKKAVYGEGSEVSEVEGKSVREGSRKEEVLGVGGSWSYCEGGLDKVEVFLKQMWEWQSFCAAVEEKKIALKKANELVGTGNNNSEGIQEKGGGEGSMNAVNDALRTDVKHRDNRVNGLPDQIGVVVQLSRLVRQFSCLAMLLIVLVGVPLYTTLSSFYGSYEYQYGWTPTAAFLSGESAAISLLVLFLVVAGCLSWFRSWHSSSVVHDVVSGGERGYESAWSCVRCFSVGVLVGCGKSVRKKWRYLVVMVLITVGNVAVVMVVNATYVYLYVQISVLQAFFLSMAMSGFKLLWCRILFLVLSRCVARRGGGVREGEVQQKAGVSSYGDEAFEDNEAGGSCLSKNTEEEGYSKKKETEKKVNSQSGWDSATISIYSSLMLFNTIVAPCLATLLISSDCFYYVFASPPSVSVSYTYPMCASFNVDGCLRLAKGIYTFEFQPPFSYSYQCSSALLQEYGYVFVYKYLLLGVVHPVVVLLLAFYHDDKEKKSLSENDREGEDGNKARLQGVLGSVNFESSRSDEFISPLHRASVADVNSPYTKELRSSSFSSTSALLLPSLWRKYHHHLDDNASYSRSVDSLSELSSGADARSAAHNIFSNFLQGLKTYFVEEANFDHIFCAAEYSGRLTMMIGTLVTFGVVLPYLSVLVCLSIVTNTYLTQWALARFSLLSGSKKRLQKSSVDHDEDSGSLLLVDGSGESNISNNLNSKRISINNSSTITINSNNHPVRDLDVPCEELVSKNEKQMSVSSSSSTVLVSKETLVIEHISNECKQLPEALLVAVRPLSILMVLFLSCFLFDIAGDKEGAWVGFYFVLVMCLVPLLGVMVHGMWVRLRLWYKCDGEMRMFGEERKRSEVGCGGGDGGEELVSNESVEMVVRSIL